MSVDVDNNTSFSSSSTRPRASTTTNVVNNSNNRQSRNAKEATTPPLNQTSVLLNPHFLSEHTDVTTNKHIPSAVSQLISLHGESTSTSDANPTSSFDNILKGNPDGSMTFDPLHPFNENIDLPVELTQQVGSSISTETQYENQL
jgi:hypothetical protein